MEGKCTNPSKDEKKVQMHYKAMGLQSNKQKINKPKKKKNQVRTLRYLSFRFPYTRPTEKADTRAT